MPFLTTYYLKVPQTYSTCSKCRHPIDRSCQSKERATAIYRGLSQSKKHLSCLLCLSLWPMAACFILWLRFNPCSHAFVFLRETVFYLFDRARFLQRDPLPPHQRLFTLFDKKMGPMLYAWYYSCYQADDILTFTFPSTHCHQVKGANITPLIVNEFWTYSFAPLTPPTSLRTLRVEFTSTNS